MQKDAAIKVELHKSGRRYGLAVGLGLIACACLANDPGAQRIFRCETNGRIVFSDLPCPTAPSMEVVLRPTNSYHADVPAVSPGTRKNVASDRQATRQLDRQADAIAAEQQRAKLNCQRMADQLINIENTMRSGYSAKQGERLRERQRQLELRRRTERCR